MDLVSLTCEVTYRWAIKCRSFAVRKCSAAKKALVILTLAPQIDMSSTQVIKQLTSIQKDVLIERKRLLTLL